MKFQVKRENLLEPLQLVTSVVERRQTLPVLSNLLLEASDAGLVLTGTDQEVELASAVRDVDSGDTDAVTVPARKLLDICRSLPDGAPIEVSRGTNRVSVTSGRFKSHLATLPAEDFPKVEMGKASATFSLAADDLGFLLDRCSFAMAQQDVRYFFNGMLLEISPDSVRAVATNSQRLATTYIERATSVTAKLQVIVPRKGVVELARVVPGGEDPVTLQLSDNHMRVSTASGATLTTKLVDATYPDYTRAIPAGGDKTVVGDRREIREALSRTSILSNEMYRNVRLQLTSGKLEIHANNPLQEEAEESVSVDYQGTDLEIGFNVGYLIDALGVMQGDKVQMCFSDASSAALFTDSGDDRSRFVISPMML